MPCGGATSSSRSFLSWWPSLILRLSTSTFAALNMSIPKLVKRLAKSVIVEALGARSQTADAVFSRQIPFIARPFALERHSRAERPR